MKILIFSFFFHLNVESLVTYPNNKTTNFLNDDLLLTCMVHIRPHRMDKRKSFVFCISGLWLCFRRGLTLSEKNWIISNCKSEINNVCNALEGNCLEVMKIVHHHANGRFYWLISAHQSVNPSREAISTLSGKYKIFTFVYPVFIAIHR